MRSDDEKRDKLEKMEKKLYARESPDIMDKGRSELTTDLDDDILEGSQDDLGPQSTNRFDALAAKMSHMSEKKHSLMKKVFILSVAFFVLALGVAAFVFFGEMNLVSTRNVDIKVLGPLSVAAGGETSFDIIVENHNNTELQSVALIVEYPEGTRSATDLSLEIQRDRFAIGAIRAGEEYTQNAKAVFFGERESIKEMHISLEYRVENSSATFYKEKEHQVIISSSPIILSATYPKEVNSGQEISLNIEVASNSKETIDDFLVKVEYPFGFVFKNSSPMVAFGDNIWRFADLKSGNKKTIRIAGTVIGEDNDEKVFKILSGRASQADERDIGVPLSEITESVLVKKPFIGLGVLVNGAAVGNIAVSENNLANVELVVQNNLPERLYNVLITVTLSGVFDKLSVDPQSGGFFQSANNTILWDKRSVAEFSEMPPGSIRRLSFRFLPLSYEKIAALAGSNSNIGISATAAGERILESGSIEKVAASASQTLSLSSDIDVTTRTVRSLGQLENSGPIPPKPNLPTTYNVIWSIENTFNQVSNVEVRAILPSYVEWTGLYTPSNESITWHASRNEIVWNAGTVFAGAGFNSPKKEVYLQLRLLPSTSQIGETPLIMGESALTGLDKATGLQVRATAPSVTTNFSTDPTYRVGDGKVAP